MSEVYSKLFAQERSTSGPLNRISRNLSNPRILLALLAYVTALVIDPGNLGTIDTRRRLDVTQWISQGTSPIASTPDFAIKGRDGKLYYPYGIGQSLVMLPADLIAAPLSRLVSGSNETQAKIRTGIVGMLTFPLICAGTIALLYDLLFGLGFNKKESMAGSLSLLFGTTFLYYTKIHYENSLLIFLFIAALNSIRIWVDSGSRPALILAASAAGMMILTRLTTFVEVACLGVFTAGLLAIHWQTPEGKLDTKNRLKDLALVGTICFLGFCLAERLYHWRRFGGLGSTYMHVQSDLIRKRSAIKPNNWQFQQPLWTGFKKNLFYPHESIFLYDPLLLLALPLGIFGYRLVNPKIRLFLWTSLLFVVLQVGLYSKIPWPDGGAWGNRFNANSAQVACILAVPLFLRFRPYLNPWINRIAIGILGIAILIQVESVVYKVNLETMQYFLILNSIKTSQNLKQLPNINLTWDYHLFTGWQRLVNIFSVATGTFDATGLKPVEHAQHCLIPNFSPFIFQSMLPASIFKFVWAVWISLLGLWFLLLSRTIQYFRTEDYEPLHRDLAVKVPGSFWPRRNVGPHELRIKQSRQS